MPRGRGKVEFEDVRPGVGEVATREHEARIACSIFLRRGECVQKLDDCWIDLKRREAIAGLQYGIEGMRVGGLRRIIVPPHLGYGSAGFPTDELLAKAMLICEVELLDLRLSRPIPPKLKLARERKKRQPGD